MKKILGFIIFFITATLFSIPLYAKDQGKIRVAIMDFSGDDVPQREARKISDLIRTEIINTRQYIVIERNEMNKVLKEQGIQMTGCTDVSCAVQAGKLMSARKILVGTIMKINENIIINGRIVDVEKGIAEYAEKELAKNEKDIYRAVEAFSAKLTHRISPQGYAKTIQEEEAKTPTPIPLKKKESATWGWLSLGGLILTGGCGAVMLWSNYQMGYSSGSLYNQYFNIRLYSGIATGAFGLATIVSGIIWLVKLSEERTMGMNGDIKIDNNTYSLVMPQNFYNDSFNNHSSYNYTGNNFKGNDYINNYYKKGKSNLNLGLGISMKF